MCKVHYVLSLSVISILILPPVTLGDCGLRLVVDIIFDEETWIAEPVFSCAQASAYWAMTVFWCDGTSGVAAHWCGNADCSSENRAAAGCTAPDWGSAHDYICASATTFPPGSGEEILVAGGTSKPGLWACLDDPWVIWPVSSGSNASVAYAFSLVPKPGVSVPHDELRTNAWTANIAVSLPDPNSSAVPNPNGTLLMNTGIARFFPVVDSGLISDMWLMHAQTYRLAQNLSLNGEIWEGFATLSGSDGVSQLAVGLQEFRDDKYDVTGYLGLDGNGRSNVNDVVEFAAQLIGDTDPNVIGRWDFNGNGAIEGLVAYVDGHEVDGDQVYLQRAIDLQLDSGVFGDLNSDSVADCQWRSEIVDMFGAVLGDPEYRIELDYDLDGDTDADDLDQFVADACPWDLGDADCSGVVGFDDINAFQAALIDGEAAYYAVYPDCRWLNSDMDCDGTVGFGDINYFVDCMTYGLCSCPAR